MMCVCGRISGVIAIVCRKPRMNRFHTAICIGVIGAGLAACAARQPRSVAQNLPPAGTMADDAESRGDWPAAARHWENAAAAAPSDRQAALSAARALRLANACGRAAPYLQRLRQAAPDDRNVLLEAGKCHLVSGRYDAAEAAFKAALVSDPASWEAETVLGMTYDLMERPREAMVHHDRALALAPTQPMVLSNKALSLALAGDLATALTVMRAASAQPSASGRVRMNLAFLEAIAGHGDVAAMMARQESSEGEGATLLQRIAAAAHAPPHP